jgi:alkanesulfonate monooxygenase SsuD/methylene tetrahydromethanopterin reductase-like flavin-dependent oxidoreductase (luciferase family)
MSENKVRTAPGVTMPGLGRRLEEYPEFARMAEEAGFDSVWNYEFWRNPFTMHIDNAAVTSEITLGTGIAAAFIRSPFELANLAADVDERSGGRMLLGIGTGAPEFLEWFHSSHAKQPVSRLSEYIDVIRMSWDYLHTMDASTQFNGKHYRFTPPADNPWGGRELLRRRIPIYLAAMRPKMIQLAGQKADGWIGYMAPPRFLDDHVRPNLVIGAERAGRDPADVKLASETICSVHDDRSIAMERARVHVGMNVCNPISDAQVSFFGLERDRDAVRDAVRTEGIEASRTVTSDALVEALSMTGTPAEVRAKLAEHEASLDHVILHTPYVPPLTPDEAADAYDMIVRTFAEEAP